MTSLTESALILHTDHYWSVKCSGGVRGLVPFPGYVKSNLPDSPSTQVSIARMIEKRLTFFFTSVSSTNESVTSLLNS